MPLPSPPRLPVRVPRLAPLLPPPGVGRRRVGGRGRPPLRPVPPALASSHSLVIDWHQQVGAAGGRGRGVEAGVGGERHLESWHSESSCLRREEAGPWLVWGKVRRGGKEKSEEKR